jgi:hypothetical protein
VIRAAAALLLTLLLTGCATTAVDMTEPRRIVGTENSVRIDAQVTGDEIIAGTRIPITYEITNQRATAIAVADMIPETSYDAETHTFTIGIGSEVPGNELVPRLIEIGPGEKKSFSTVARIASVLPPRSADPTVAQIPAEFRLKLNFLGDTAPFARLLTITEKAIADPKLADELFPAWLERNEVVYTNAIPMRWRPRARESNVEPRVPGRRRGGI